MVASTTSIITRISAIFTITATIAVPIILITLSLALFYFARVTSITASMIPVASISIISLTSLPANWTP